LTLEEREKRRKKRAEQQRAYRERKSQNMTTDHNVNYPLIVYMILMPSNFLLMPYNTIFSLFSNNYWLYWIYTTFSFQFNLVFTI